MYHPDENYLGGFTPNDGTIEFYGRIKALAEPTHTVLDLGAGRAAWFEDDTCAYRRQIQTLKGHVAEVIAADIDEVVLNNRSSDRNVVINGSIPLPDNSVDIIVADYVLEHIQDPDEFVSEVRRLLKPSGYFCARTPHKYSYIALGARLVPNRKHVDYLKNLQPDRQAQDVFPTAYRLNTMASIGKSFSGFENFSYVFSTDPAYYLGNRTVYKTLQSIHHVTPSWFSGNIFAFLRKI
ncbi:class I SAM-dependent methyltransferase [Tritonibacter scottomollicae]|uniref:class I SAM-dependent methyltransferase n=1 Tax=Tritonibacter scottomollicae TaxID=483013 RepID=UPI003AA8046C